MACEGVYFCNPYPKFCMLMHAAANMLMGSSPVQGGIYIPPRTRKNEGLIKGSNFGLHGGGGGIQNSLFDLPGWLYDFG